MLRKVRRIVRYKKKYITALLLFAFAAPSWAETMTPEVSANNHQPSLLSAFFGLDNSLPFRANLLCLGASSTDGMPVIFSRTLDPESLQAEDFSVITRSGARKAPLCATLRPALDTGETRAMLLIGDFGDADYDPPQTVQIVDDLLSDGSKESLVNFVGAQVRGTPLTDGPSVVLAQIVPKRVWSQTGVGPACPSSTKQVVRITWSGGVRLPNGDEPAEAERILYRITVDPGDGIKEGISVAALADPGDNDNNYLLINHLHDRSRFRADVNVVYSEIRGAVTFITSYAVSTP